MVRFMNFVVLFVGEIILWLWRWVLLVGVVGVYGVVFFDGV